MSHFSAMLYHLVAAIVMVTVLIITSNRSENFLARLLCVEVIKPQELRRLIVTVEVAVFATILLAIGFSIFGEPYNVGELLLNLAVAFAAFYKRVW